MSTKVKKKLTSKKKNKPLTVVQYREIPRERDPNMVEIPREKVLALVFNMMDSEADKRVGPETLAMYFGNLTQEDVDDFVLKTVRKLPGYSLRDGLRIADCLTRWRLTYFDAPQEAAEDDCSYN
jgi:hypothetical protein